jgi:hypothetical protein
MPTKKCRANSPKLGLSDYRLWPEKLREEPVAEAEVAQQATETLGYIKSCPVKNLKTVRDWAARHDYCQVCLISERAARWRRLTGLQTHHIIKPGRSDEACNLLRVCEQCHRIIEGERVPDNQGGYFPKLTLAHVLHCKRELDPHEYDPDRLTVLWRHRERKDGFDPLPRPQPLPAAFGQERRRWRL